MPDSSMLAKALARKAQLEQELAEIEIFLRKLKHFDEKTPTVKMAGKAGGNARAGKLSPERRSEIARIAAKARWKS